MLIKSTKADILNKSVQFFKENSEFSFDDFTSQVIQQPEEIQSFKEYKEEYEDERDVEINCTDC